MIKATFIINKVYGKANIEGFIQKLKNERIDRVLGLFGMSRALKLEWLIETVEVIIEGKTDIEIIRRVE